MVAKLISGGEKLKSDGSLIHEPEIERAKDHLKKAISINKNFAKAYYKLGLLLVDNKEYKDAMKNFESAISNDKILPKLTIKLPCCSWMKTH